MQTKSIERAILMIRGQKIILDYELAELYKVQTKALKQAAKRNLNSFPSDFMFVLTDLFMNFSMLLFKTYDST
jgi:hypothetical protein